MTNIAAKLPATYDKTWFSILVLNCNEGSRMSGHDNMHVFQCSVFYFSAGKVTWMSGHDNNSIPRLYTFSMSGHNNMLFNFWQFFFSHGRKPECMVTTTCMVFDFFSLFLATKVTHGRKPECMVTPTYT